MLKKVLVGIVGVVVLVTALVVGAALNKPTTFEIERNTLVSAPPSAIYPNLEDFHRISLAVNLRWSRRQPKP